MATTKSQAFRTIASISLISIVSAMLVTGSHVISHERIAENHRARLIQSLHEVLDPSSYNNDLISSQISVHDPELLGSVEPLDVFIATLSDQPIAVLFSSVAPRGYNGPIRLLIGVTVDGTVSGVRVTDHNETPGLGDAIDIDKSNWVIGFVGTTLASPPLESWAVKQDNGSFDALTGATITPRAIVDGVHKTLLYFERHKNELFSITTPTRAIDE